MHYAVTTCPCGIGVYRRGCIIIAAQLCPSDLWQRATVMLASCPEAKASVLKEKADRLICSLTAIVRNRNWNREPEPIP